MVEIKEVKDLELIRNLWGVLNRHKQIHSRHFKNHFRNKTFDDVVLEVEQCEDFRLEVIYQDSSVLGFCLGSRCEDHGKIKELYVHDDLRGNGLGGYLFKRMVLWLETQGCETIELEVSAGNEEVISFYHKYGFNTFEYRLRMAKEE